MEQTGNLCLRSYLFSLSKHFRQDRASESQSYHFSACDLPAGKTELLEKRPKWLVLTGSMQGHMLPASGDTECVCVCARNPPPVCVRVRTGSAKHDTLGCERVGTDQNARSAA